MRLYSREDRNFHLRRTLRHRLMKNWHWIVIGALVGAACGSIFGMDYALAGLGIGLAGGAAIMLGMR